MAGSRALGAEIGLLAPEMGGKGLTGLPAIRINPRNEMSIEHVWTQYYYLGS
jgi:hypothetical protein